MKPQTPFQGAISSLVVLLVLISTPAIAQPEQVSFQGFLTVDDGGNQVPFDGWCEFKFAIVDPAGPVTVWSNDGSSALGGEPDSSVSVDVDQGFYLVNLGKDMEPLSAATFAPYDVLNLETWVDTGTGFDQLTTIKMGSAPFTLHSRSAEKSFGDFTSDGGITAVGEVTSTSGGFRFPDNTLQTTAAAPGSFWSLFGNSGTNDLNFVGTTDDQKLKFKVNDRIAFRLEPVDPDCDGPPNVVGGFATNSATSGACGAAIGGGGGVGEPNRVTDHFGTVGGGLANVAGNGNGTYDDAMYGTVGGGYENTAQWRGSTVGGGIDNAVQMNYGTIAGGRNNVVDGTDALVAGGQGNTASGSNAAVAGGSSNTAGGNYSFVAGGSDNSAQGSHSFAAGKDAYALASGAFVWSDASGGATLSGGDNSFTARASGGTTFQTSVLRIGDRVGREYFRFDTSDSTAYVPVLEITGGSDLAEPFPISDREPLSPGTVVVIDADHAGHLKKSDRAYDPCVAGIISGAGGINPGLTLRHESRDTEDQNLALTGRVYAFADADPAPIRPGDLLTTSDVPGHAMRAVDPGRRGGAVIGKAMTSLDRGRGLVLVLVDLQ